jgi:hypothetical protein
MTYRDARIQAKLKYLTRLLKFRVRLMDYVDDVEVELSGEIVKIRWIGKPIPKKISFFEEIEFPLSHIGRRIEHYKRKVRMEFSKRHG